MTFLNANEILYERQFGFRHNHSTTHALSAITEKIRQACDSGNFACGVFLDLKKAFHTMNHEILLKKLEYYGIKGITNSIVCIRVSTPSQKHHPFFLTKPPLN